MKRIKLEKKLSKRYWILDIGCWIRYIEEWMLHADSCKEQLAEWENV